MKMKRYSNDEIAQILKHQQELGGVLPEAQRAPAAGRRSLVG
jgi:hypothetical protein